MLVVIIRIIGRPKGGWFEFEKFELDIFNIYIYFLKMKNDLL